jgi:hypothetical protein
LVAPRCATLQKCGTSIETSEVIGSGKLTYGSHFAPRCATLSKCGTSEKIVLFFIIFFINLNNNK